jgi:hypothetical protein
MLLAAADSYFNFNYNKMLIYIKNNIIGIFSTIDQQVRQKSCMGLMRTMGLT